VGTTELAVITKDYALHPVYRGESKAQNNWIAKRSESVIVTAARPIAFLRASASPR
jgi:hypothetical protein